MAAGFHRRCTRLLGFRLNSQSIKIVKKPCVQKKLQLFAIPAQPPNHLTCGHFKHCKPRLARLSALCDEIKHLVWFL
jgi:hypothetical protein